MSLTCKEPKLRFKEFIGDWEQKNLANVSDVIDSLHQTPKNYTLHGYPMIRITDVNNGYFDLNKCRKVSEKDFKKFTQKYKPKFDDIILSRVGTCGASIQLKTHNEVCLGQNIVLLIPSINKVFLYVLIKSHIIQNQVNKKVVGSTQKTLSIKDLKDFKINVPKTKEQEKIASFLSEVYKKEEILTCKENLLQKYKKGVMQKIFSKEIRFKADDGSEYFPWKEKRLGDIATFFSGGTPSSSNKSYYDGHIPFIGSGKINSETVEQFITTEALENSSAKMVKTGDLLYALYGATSGEVSISKLNGAINQAILCIRSDENINFLNKWLQFNKENILSKYLQGGQGNLSAQIIKNLKLYLPSIEEQIKIANFLLIIDKKLLHVKTQLKKHKEFKKALLQQIFV